MERLKTLPELRNHFAEVLKQWHQCNEIVSVPKTQSPYYEMMKTAHAEQRKIGFDSFLKGFLSNKWSEIQNMYYRKEVKDPFFNADRWRKSVVMGLIDYGTTMWKERCNILHAENQFTEETRYREFLRQLQDDLRRDGAKKLHVMDRFLLKKKRNFFLQAERPHLDMWHIRIKNAIQQEEKRKQSSGYNIEPYVKRKKRAKRV